VNAGAHSLLKSARGAAPGKEEERFLLALCDPWGVSKCRSFGMTVQKLNRGGVGGAVEEWCESGDDGDAKGFLARDCATGQDAPGALIVANAVLAGEGIDGVGELDTFIYDFTSERPRQKHATGLAERGERAVGDVGPIV